ncbi:MAG: hypothetical protein FJ267_05175, partial [Planctomycetes bacterium]|nr:hypothetical protein [Planctomycetota bacterium]
MNRIAFRAVMTVAIFGLSTYSANAQSIGNSITTFLDGNIGKRVGGGECAHLATEALRVGGGEFVSSDLGADSPAAGDYVWGTLVTVISFSNKQRTDSNPTNLAQPGDIIQYYAATFTYSKTSVVKTATRHTSLIRAVNSTGRPTSIYQQNFNGVKTVQTATI